MTSYNPRDSVFNQPKPVVHLPQDLLQSITKAVQPYPIPEGKKYEYGTAGVCIGSDSSDNCADRSSTTVSDESVRNPSAASDVAL